MELEIAKTLSPESVAILIAVTIYVVKTAWEFISTTILKSKSEVEDNTQAIRELMIKLEHLNNRLVSVQLAIDKLDEFKLLTYKLEKDMGYAFEKIRDIKTDRDR